MVWSRTLDPIVSRIGRRNTAGWLLTDRTQFDERKQHGRIQQLVIGLDFGTAFTKVVIGEQLVRYAVPFAPFLHKDNRYLLPSGLSVVGDTKVCLLGFAAGVDHWVDDLKMRLIQRDFSVESRVCCAAFLTLVLRFVRAWFLEEQKDTYKDREIVWQVNIGLPTDSYHDQELEELYREITRVAWTVSVLPGPVSLGRIQHYFGKGESELSRLLPRPFKHRLLNSQSINTFPEFAVQLVGYVRSPRREEGLHALVDVGAGTMDVTTFNVYKDEEGEDLFPIFARGVEPLGTRFLIQHRLAQNPPTSDWNPSPFEDVPPDSVFETKLSLRRAALQELDRPFLNRVEKVILDKLNYTKKCRDPRSEHWKSGVPTFLCGGGARVDCFSGLFGQFEAASPPFKIKANSLTVPEDLSAPEMPRGTYDRLSVAYGLSYDPDNIGRILRMEDIEDIPKGQSRTERYRDRYVDKDMV